MVSKASVLQPGEVYFGTQTGQYLLLGREGSNLKVRFANGTEGEIDADVAERTVRDFEAELEAMGLTAGNEERRRKFIRAIGFLAKGSVIRAVVAPGYALRFKEGYQLLTGKSADESPSLQVLQSDGDIWGPELSVEWDASLFQMNQIHFGLNIQMSRRGGQGEYRITNNMFLYKLFEWGFVLGDKQDPDRIRGRLPDYARADFDKGLKY
jgi:hypothetical protein